MKNTTITEIINLWDKVLSIVSEQFDKQLYDAFFKNTKIDSINGDKINVLCDSELTKTVLEEKYLPFLESTVNKITGSNYHIAFYTSKDEIVYTPKNDLSTSSQFFKRNIIDPNYNFDNFVVGPFNNEAHKASLIVASNPGTFYQTLFIYGGSGLGKTHLLNSIGNYIKENNPTKKVLICSSQDFINEYLEFVSTDSRKELLTKFLRKFDVFLIDDIQMLKDKRKTQEFFFQIYEEFRQSGKQVVLTSDKLPGDLDGIDTRLITRFTSGLSVPICQPDVDTCVEILKKKIVASGFELENYDPQVFALLANAFKDSIRSLEGALIRLNFFASLNRIQYINLEVTEQALEGMFDSKAAKEKISERKILEAVASYYGISVSQIIGKIKTANIAFARHLAIYLIRTLLDTPYKKIGETFAGRDHSTVMHSVEKIQKLVDNDTQIRNIVNDVKSRISSK